MNWSFGINDRLPYSKVEVVFDPENEVLSTFFHSVRLRNFPLLADNACESTGFAEERSGVLFYGDLDEYDIASGEGFEPDEVQVYQLDTGDATLKQEEFMTLLRDYMAALIQAYSSSPDVSEEWLEQLKTRFATLNSAVG
jgi:hypothetical protein